MIALLVTLALADEPATVTAALGKGITVTSVDGKTSMNLRGRFQLRESLFVAAPDDDGARDVTLQTQLVTARIWLGGTVFSEDTTYALQLAVAPKDYRDGATSPVFDAYLDLAQHRDVSVRVGQTFVPFDRLRTIREFALQLPERPRAVSELALDRDLGVYLYSDHLGGDASPVAYRLGVFGGSGIHQITAHAPGGLVVGRVELRPLGPIDDDSEGDLERHPKPGLALGLAAAYNVATTRARSTTSTVYLGGTATYAHLAADAVFKWRGFALEGEFIARDAAEDQLLSTAPDGSDRVEYTRSGWGVVAQPSLLVTDRVEVAARYARLAAAEGTDPAYVADATARANEVGFGVSEYLNGHRFKVQQGVTAFLGDATSPGDAEVSAHVLLDATF